MNKVDELQAQTDNIQAKIKAIQENCEHNFVLTEPLILRETLVPGVYVGVTSGPSDLSRIAGWTGDFTFRCPACSLIQRASVETTCPYCFEPMKAEESLRVSGPGPLWENSRKIYFGREYIYYSIRLYNCYKDRFTVASDEWNQ